MDFDLPMEELELPLIGELFEDKSGLPTPEEVTYWKLRKDRTFFIDYEIKENYYLIELSKTIIQMNIAEKDIPKEQLKPIYIFIHSFGGDTYQALYFADLLISSRIPIVTVGMGVCMSSGFLIFLAGHRRYAFRHCQMLVHTGSATISGTAEQVEQAQKNYKKQINAMKNYILWRTKIDAKTFEKNKEKDWYLNNHELTKFKVVDKLINSLDDIL